MYYVVSGIVNFELRMENFAIYDLRFTIFSFLPCSPREIGKAVISWGKSAKSAVIDYFLVFIGTTIFQLLVFCACIFDKADVIV